MAVRNLTERVEVLEMKVGVLEELPARMSAVEAQIVQLRTEMRGEFSAVRQEMRALNDETRAEIRIGKTGEVTRSPRKGGAKPLRARFPALFAQADPRS
jgi:hypothetical protein